MKWLMIGILLLVGCGDNVHPDEEYYEEEVKEEDVVVLYTSEGDTIQVWKGDIGNFIIYEVGECRFRCDGRWVEIYAGEGVIVYE